ncbi:extracellular matrix protein 2-like isoform X2 [Pleurodeles waltl]|uniref:extracellular matrix protein 2-like isoform X2 n=1 Tax=Pleurodeles waltl TaxID=8319 RepID=UPI00370990C4
MRLLCTLLALGLWGVCHGWPKKTPDSGGGPRQEATERGPLAKAARPARRAPKASPTQSPRGAQLRQSGLLHLIQAGRGQCEVNGMLMYDGAAWSPDPCTMCICDRGTQVCDVTYCKTVKCPTGSLRTPPGGCCPICTEPGTSSPKLMSTTKGPSHEAAKGEKKSKLKEKVQRERNVLEEKKKAVQVSKHKKEAPKKTRDTAFSKQGGSIKQDSMTKKEVASTAKTPLAAKHAHALSKEELSSRVKPTHITPQVGTTTKNPGDKKPEVAGTTRLEATESAATESPLHVKEAVGKRVASDGQVKETTKEKNPHDDQQGRHLGWRGESDKVSPTAEIDAHIMPSLPTGCLLTETTIACANTKMKRLPQLIDAGLKTLYLAENEIAHLPADAFAGLPNLEWLDLSKNKLEDAGVAMDVFKNLTKLKRLNLDGNRLTAVPPLPPLLQELKMNDNRIQGLQRHSFRGLYKLLTLELEGNDFHDGNVYPLSFKPLRSLIYLRLDRNRFRAVPSGLPTSLQELHLDNNRIEQVSEGLLNKTMNLTALVLSNNRLQEDRIAPRAWIDLPKLETLDLSYNRLVHVPSFLPRGLRQLRLHHNQIERIPGYVFAHMKPGLEFLHLSHNRLREDGIHGSSFLGLYKSLAELLLDNNLLHAVPRGLLSLKALQVLRLSFNRIRYVPLNSICDMRVPEDSNLISVHLENNLIDRHLIPPMAFSCIKTYYSVVLRPQQNEDEEYY